MLSTAAAISAAVEAEGRLRQVQIGLRAEEEQANDAVKVKFTAAIGMYSRASLRSLTSSNVWR